MKKFLFLLALALLISSSVFSQNDEKNTTNNIMNVKWDDTTYVVKCSEFHVTKPLIEIISEHPVPQFIKGEEKDNREQEHRPVQKFVFNSLKDGLKYGNDLSIIQTKQGDVKGKAPIQSWNGQVASGFRPFDPTGAVSSNYYIQMINSTTYSIYSKTGNVLATGVLGDLWATPTANAGDPIVLYDKDADRWFFSQFGDNNNNIYIAISATNNPLGSWYTYTFTSPDFPDYLKFSVWADGYYMTANYAQKVFAFNRTKMLAGDGSAEAIYKAFTPPSSGFFVPLTGDASDGTMPTVGTPCPIFCYSDNAWGAGISDAINIYQMSVNWTNLTATITSAGSLPLNSFDASYNAGWYDIAQPGTTQKLDGIGGAMWFRSQYRKWSGYNTALCDWGVKVSSTQRGIFWCELRQDQTSGNWSVYQQSIYAPGTDSYWMGSMAMNDNGDIALAYAKGSSNTSMSLGYVGRHADDTLNFFTIAETIAIGGTGSQTSTNRVGDYSHMCLDPDGLTFWHTGEYMKGADNVGTRIYSFTLPIACTPPTTQATDFSVVNVGDNQVKVKWHRGNGDKVLVVLNQGSSIDAYPINGIYYNADSTFGSGDHLSSTAFAVYNGTDTVVTVKGLISGTKQYFTVFEYNTADNCYLYGGLFGDTTTTGVAPITYCSPSSSSDDATGITNVAFNTINNTSTGTNAYTNFTNINTILVKGQSYKITVKVNTYGNYTVYAKAWIDWNHDGDFATNEVYDLGSKTNTTNGVTSLTPNITVPYSAILDTIVMRVRATYKTAPTPCDDQNFSEAEDYSLIIQNANAIENINNNLTVNVFPNPNNGNFVVRFENFNKPFDVKITDVLGKVVYTGVLNQNENNIYLGNQKQGMYFLNIKNESDNQTFKIIIQ